MFRARTEQLERRLALAVATPFTVRYTANDTGDITFAANTLMTAPDTPDGINARNGVGTKLNNNNFEMEYVDVDSDPSTFNSSQAALVLPAGSQVLFAGLYWGGRTNSTYPTGLTSQRNNLLFKGPDDTAYVPLTGATIGTSSSSYHAFEDVTSLVADQGAGIYTVANVQAIAESDDKYAAWSLVVAYRAPGEPARNLTVFDGYGSVTSSDPDVTIPISGFKAPPSGPVNATLGFIAYEGDLGYSGDKVFFDGGLGPVQLSNAANPATNFFNSTISNRGSLVTTKDPNYVNQLGFDADLVAANSVIANSATAATIRLTTSDETYYPGVVTSAIELFAPEVDVVKEVEDVDGGFVEAGDVLRYTITVSNAATALDAAVNVLLTDAIPEFTTYRPGSLVITSGANAGAKTDAADGDQAEYLVIDNAVRFQLGSGAAGFGTPGGRLAPGATTTVTFEVIVDAVIPGSTLIENVANVSFAGETSGFSLMATDFALIATPAFADLQVTKNDGQTQYVPGTTATYTIVVTNAGPSTATGARVRDVMPAEFASPTWTAIYSSGGSGPLAGSGTIDALVDLPAGATATFTVTAPIRAEAFGDITNVVVVTPPAGLPDPVPTNNTATDTNTFLAPAALDVTKTVVDINGGVILTGDVLRYTVVVRNLAASPAEAAANVILDDVIPSNTAYRPGTLVITSGANAGAKTDAVDGDQAEFIAGSNAVRFQLGTGAGGGSGSPVGGSLAAGESTTITFEVIVDAGIPPSTVITNTATATGTGAVSGFAITDSGSVGVATPPAADLTVVKTGPSTFTPGVPFEYRITVTNSGPTAVSGVAVSDVLPAGITSATWTATYTGAGSTGPAAGSGDIASSIDLDDLGTATFVIVATPASTIAAFDLLTNTASATNPAGTPDPNPGDNTSSVTSQSAPLTDLSVTKTDGQSTYVPGSTVTYTIVVRNDGPSFAAQASVVDTLDPAVIASATWTAVFNGAGSTGVTSGSGSLSEIIDLAAGGTAIYTVVAQTLPTATASLVNTVVVSTSNLSNDPDPANNSATDIDTPDFAPAIIVAPDMGCVSSPLVRVLDPVTGAVRAEFLAYEPTFRGGVRVFGADMTGDGIPEIITAPGPGRPGLVKVFTQDGTELTAYRTLPFGPTFNGGVEVAAGDVTGDGLIDLVAAQGGAGSLVSVFTVTPAAADPVANTPARQIQPFGRKFRGGARVATADIGTFSGTTFMSAAPDGIAELVVGSGPGIKATVNTYNAVPATPALVNTVRPIAPGYARGVGVAALPSNSPAVADRVLVTAGTAGGSKVETYAGVAKVPAASFAAYGDAARAAVWSTALDDANIFSVQGSGGKIAGVRKHTAPSGGTSSTLAGSTGIPAPLRISVLRRSTT